MSRSLCEQVPLPFLKLLLVDLPACIPLLENFQRRVFTMSEPLFHEPSDNEDASYNQHAPEEHHAYKAEAHHGHPAAVGKSVHHVEAFRRLEEGSRFALVELFFKATMGASMHALVWPSGAVTAGTSRRPQGYHVRTFWSWWNRSQEKRRLIAAEFRLARSDRMRPLTVLPLVMYPLDT